MQAAVGVAQLPKLPRFIAVRRANFARLYEGLKPLEDRFILPEATPRSEPSWFGFALTIRPGVKIDRLALTQHLESRRIGTRLLFGGNLMKQPAYKDLPCRVVGSLDSADVITTNTFWIGVHPGLDDLQVDYLIESIHDFVASS